MAETRTAQDLSERLLTTKEVCQILRCVPRTKSQRPFRTRTGVTFVAFRLAKIGLHNGKAKSIENIQDQSWMPIPAAIPFDYLTADFTYVRLLGDLGDRKGIEKQTKVWNKVIVNRTKELWNWIDICQQAAKRGVKVYVYINNHYAGFAPASVAQFVSLWTGQAQ